MPTKQNSLFAALRLLPVGAAVTALFLSGASAAFANPHILVDVSTGRVLEHEKRSANGIPHR